MCASFVHNFCSLLLLLGVSFGIRWFFGFVVVIRSWLKIQYWFNYAIIPAVQSHTCNLNSPKTIYFFVLAVEFGISHSNSAMLYKFSSLNLGSSTKIVGLFLLNIIYYLSHAFWFLIFKSSITFFVCRSVASSLTGRFLLVPITTGHKNHTHNRRNEFIHLMGHINTWKLT